MAHVQSHQISNEGAVRAVKAATIGSGVKGFHNGKQTCSCVLQRLAVPVAWICSAMLGSKASRAPGSASVAAAAADSASMFLPASTHSGLCYM